MVRVRNRYVVAKINYLDPQAAKITKNLYNKNQLLHATLVKAIRDLHGIHGVAVSSDGLFINYFNTETNVIFVKMHRSVYRIVSSALAFIKALNNEPVSIQTMYTGATIKHCNIFVQKHYRRELESEYSVLKTDVEKQEFQQQLNTAVNAPRFISFKKGARRNQ